MGKPLVICAGHCFSVVRGRWLGHALSSLPNMSVCYPRANVDRTVAFPTVWHVFDKTSTPVRATKPVTSPFVLTQLPVREHAQHHTSRFNNIHHAQLRSFDGWFRLQTVRTVIDTVHRLRRVVFLSILLTIIPNTSMFSIRQQRAPWASTLTERRKPQGAKTKGKPMQIIDHYYYYASTCRQP